MTNQQTTQPTNHPTIHPLPLAAHHLRISLTVETPIELDQHPGASLRGMLYNALRGSQNNPAGGFCVQRHLKTCADCSLIAACPVAGLVATMNPQAERGRDVPRPYTIEPPLTVRPNYIPGDQLTFGLTLLGDALTLFPYVVMALRQAGPYGLGKKLPQETSGGHFHRGRFELRRVEAINLLTGEAQTVLEPGSTLVQQPSLPVTSAQVEAEAERMLSLTLPVAGNGRDRNSAFQQGQIDQLVDLVVQFLTPTRLTYRKQLLKKPEFSPLFHRLLERLSQLSREYVVTQGPVATIDESALLSLADSVALVDNQTGWREVWSYSNRQGRRIPISGLMGTATYRSDRASWTVLLPFMIWGGVVHVGKNAVKGEGLIRVSPVQEV